MQTDQPNIIHFRISMFANKPEEESRISSLFNNWLIKSLSNGKKNLNGLISRQANDTGANKSSIFCKNIKISEEITLWYTLNVLYENDAEKRLDPRSDQSFYRNYLIGSNIIVFVIDNLKSFEILIQICRSLQSNIGKSIVVFNISKISTVSNILISEE